MGDAFAQFLATASHRTWHCVPHAPPPVGLLHRHLAWYFAALMRQDIGVVVALIGASSVQPRLWHVGRHSSGPPGKNILKSQIVLMFMQ